MNDEQLEVGVNEIREKCSLMLDNIAAGINKKFILKGVAPHNQLLFANPESLKFFENNFFERLTEVFYTLNWAYAFEELKPQVEDRFRLYENIYNLLASNFGENDLPEILKKMYNEAKSQISSAKNL
jgi:predicted nucleotidyltransferase